MVFSLAYRKPSSGGSSRWRWDRSLWRLPSQSVRQVGGGWKRTQRGLEEHSAICSVHLRRWQVKVLFGGAEGRAEPDRRDQWSDVDLTGVAAGLFALSGVGLGSWLSTRSQRTLLIENHRRETQRAREDACVRFLVAFRQFRSFLMTEPAVVRVVKAEGQTDDQGTPVVEGATRYWEAMREATARLEILMGPRSPVRVESRNVFVAISHVARARASCGPGEISGSIIKLAQEAEEAFADVVRQELDVSRPK